MSSIYKALIKSNINYNCDYYSDNYLTVKKYAKTQVHPFYYEPMNVHVQSYVEIYKNGKLIETVYNNYTTKILLIQRWWKKMFLKRKLARFFIKQKIIRAMLNPYTQLGKNLLLNSFKKLQNLNDFNFSD
jgi:hypothetical protein